MDPSHFLLEHCPELISHHAATGEILYASPAAASVLGRDPEALRGRSLFDWVPAEDAGALREAFQRALAGGAPAAARYRVAREGGDAWVESSLRAVPAGEAAGTLVAVTRDVDARARAEADAEARRARAEEAAHHRDVLIEIIPGVVWRTPVQPDGTYRVAMLSAYLERVTGYTAEEWLGTPGFWRSIIHPDDLERTIAGTARMLKEGGHLEPYRIRASDGRPVWLQSTVYIERDPTGAARCMYGLTLDVTIYKEAERRVTELLQRTREDAAERERLLLELSHRAERILELSAPLIPITDRAVVMPLLGPVDATRGGRVLDALLAGVDRLGATLAILDLTGAPSVDAEGARALLDVARGARLLGAEVVLTGMRPEVARSLVALGEDLGAIETRGTLQQAITELALGRRARR